MKIKKKSGFKRNVQKTNSGKKSVSSYFTERIQNDYMKGNNTSSIKEQISFSKIADMWLNRKRFQVKETTFEKYQNIVKLHLKPCFSEVNINEITYDAVSVLTTLLSEKDNKNSKGLASKTIFDVITVLKSIVRFAARLGYAIDQSVFDYTVKLKKTPIRVLSYQEQVTLADYLLNHPSPKNTGILLCLFTGLRIGELCALLWEDIETGNESYLYVRKTMTRIHEKSEKKKTRVVISEPKSDCSIRTIPLPDSFKSLLRKPVNTKEFILTGDATKFVEPKSMQNHIKKNICGLQH